MQKWYDAVERDHQGLLSPLEAEPQVECEMEWKEIKRYGMEGSNVVRQCGLGKWKGV